MVNLFDPSDPYMTFEVKLLIIFVATHPLVILTKFGPIKYVGEEANCEKERKKKERKNSQERNKLGGIPPNLTRNCALAKGAR